jgi:hypothetical protein
MHRMRAAVGASLLILASVVLPAITSAQSQTGGTIGGLVKDTTGAVLPGVAVEASSTALIEKVRTAVTDGAGVYKIVDLRPGVYTVTFTLASFSTLRRDGIELSAGFTATINADLRLGAVEETITVSGQSPLVDVQGTTQRRAISAEVFENLPTGKTPSNLAVLIPGVVGGAGSSQDVGGTSRHGPTPVAVYGSRSAEHMPTHDGMKFGSMWNTGGGRHGYWTPNPAFVEEFAVATSGASADVDVGRSHRLAAGADDRHGHHGAGRRPPALHHKAVTPTNVTGVPRAVHTRASMGRATYRWVGGARIACGGHGPRRR